jgi:hypothetical protein
MHPFASILAYLDPGSGSYLIQILIAALLGGGFVIKSFWKQISAFFARLFKKSAAAPQEEITDEQPK